MARPRYTVGVDIGTSSSKGTLVDAGTGQIVATTAVEHRVSTPRSGWFEMDAEIWWTELTQITSALLADIDPGEVGAVGVSGMGPCVLLTDETDRPVRPAILYGVDTRATEQIRQMSQDLGEAEIAAIAGSILTSQAAGPKVLWISQEEPEAYARARRLFMPASFLAHRLTGNYTLDHQSASQCTPLYDVESNRWHQDWWDRYAPGIEAPPLNWADQVAGTVTPNASATTGLPAGIPVITGTIDAWSEAVSVGAHEPGTLMLMYGTTMFLVATGTDTLRTPSMWTTVGAFVGTRNLAGGLSTSGSLTQWVKELSGGDYPTLLAEAQTSGPGARGLLMLPYFAGERTPIQDPDARGVIAGLTLRHTRGDLYRAALEATALGVRHNIETMRAAGAVIDRVVAVGGGTQGRLWLQIVSDATGLSQDVPASTVGASYGAAYLAARAVAGDAQADPPRIEDWNPVIETIRPQTHLTEVYDELFTLYRRLYVGTHEVAHALAAEQRREGATP